MSTRGTPGDWGPGQKPGLCSRQEGERPRPCSLSGSSERPAGREGERGSGARHAGAQAEAGSPAFPPRARRPSWRDSAPKQHRPPGCSFHLGPLPAVTPPGSFSIVVQEDLSAEKGPPPGGRAAPGPSRPTRRSPPSPRGGAHTQGASSSGKAPQAPSCLQSSCPRRAARLAGAGLGRGTGRTVSTPENIHCHVGNEGARTRWPTPPVWSLGSYKWLMCRNGSFFSSDGFLCLIITSLDAGPGGRSCGLGKLGGRGLPRGPPQLLPAAFKADIAEEAWCHWGPSPGTPGAQDAREGGPQRLALSQTPPPRPDAAQPWAPVHFPGQAAGDPGSLVLPPRLPPSSAVCSTSPEKEPGGKGAPFLGPAT